MGFGPFETSRSKGSPVELYRFRYGAFVDQAFCYTDGEKEIIHQGLTYKPLPIKRGDITASSEDSSKQSLEVNLPGSAEVAQLFRVSAPAGQIVLTIFQGHTRDPESEFIAIWVGRVGSCGWNDNDARLSCESSRSQLRRLALRRHYQYMCPHVLYGDQCRASEAAATTIASITAVNGRFVTVSGDLADPSLYPGGMVKYLDGQSILHARAILQVATVADGLRLSLSGVIEGLVAGAPISVIRGCSHNLDGCLSHQNVANYGGYPFIPVKNPLGMYGAFS